MGYNYKIIDKRRQEAPFLILEKNIYENLNVGTLAVVSEKYDTGYRLKILPKGEYINSEYTSSGKTYSKGDLVLVVFLDNYGTVALDDKTGPIMHDYKNAVIIGKVSSVKDNPESGGLKRYTGSVLYSSADNYKAVGELMEAHPGITLYYFRGDELEVRYNLLYSYSKYSSGYDIKLWYMVSDSVGLFELTDNTTIYYEYFE